MKTTTQSTTFEGCNCQSNDVHLFEVIKDIQSLIHQGRLDKVDELIQTTRKEIKELVRLHKMGVF